MNIWIAARTPPFEVGDEVLIKFVGQDWNDPRIIGYKDNPQPCYSEFLVVFCAGSDKGIVWDCKNNRLATNIPADGDGYFLTFPATADELQYWYDNSSPIIQQGYYNKVLTVEPAPYFGLDEYRNKSLDPPGVETRYCGGDELTSTFGGGSAFLQGTGYCLTSNHLSLLPTHCEVTAAQTFSGNIEWLEMPCWGEGSRVRITEVNEETIRYAPTVQFDNTLTGEYLLVREDFSWGPAPYYVPCPFPAYSEIGAPVAYSASSLKELRLDADILCTENVAFQIFLCTMNHISLHYEYLVGDPFPDYDITTSPVQYAFSCSVDYKENGLIVDGYNPKASTRHTYITNFVNQCISEDGIIYETIMVDFRTLA